MQLEIDIPSNAVEYLDKIANKEQVSRDVVIQQALLLLENEVLMNGIDALPRVNFQGR